MSYEIPTAPIPRSRRPLLVPPLIAIAVVVAALIAGPPPVPGPPPNSPAPSVPASPAPLTAATSCGDVRAFTCRATVRAAQLALETGFPPIASATAWRSLICGNDSDCPLGMLERARPAGSVVFTFIAGSVAGVNVLWLDVSSRRFEDGTELLSARVVRWYSPDS
jgi:hypothetical protein